MKTECWYSDLGDLTGHLHVLRVLICTADISISIISCCIKVQGTDLQKIFLR